MKMNWKIANYDDNNNEIHNRKRNDNSKLRMNENGKMK